MIDLFNFLWGIKDGLWRPKEGMIYRYKRWARRKHLVKTPPAFQGASWVLEGYRKQNLSEVYIEIEGTKIPGTFKISAGVCTVGIIKGKKVSKLYTTPTKNVKFYKKDLGTRVRGNDVINYTHRYEYLCKVLDSDQLVDEKIPGQIVRRRGTAIVDTPKGILVAAGKHKLFLLPGGGANKGESREKAAIRELNEETGLRTSECKFLFSYNEPDNDRKIRNLHKVFLIKAKGDPKPNYHDVKSVAYWKENSDLKLSKTTKLLIDRYLAEFKNK